MKTYVATLHYNRLGGTRGDVLMMGHNIHFKGVLWKLIPKLSFYPSLYGALINAEKAKLMRNSANGIQREIKVKEQKLEPVTSFKYLGTIVSDEGSKTEVLSRTARATVTLTKHRKQYTSWIKGKTDTLPCHIHISVRLGVMDHDGGAREKDAGL